MSNQDQNISRETIRVLAKLRVLTSDEGGHRKSGIKSGYRPNHVFESTDSKLQKTFIGEITFDQQAWIYPGEERIVNVKFFDCENIDEFIQVGREWDIYEYPNLMAKARIVEIITQSTT
jgi:hypothetical protein